jgi:hypothetical protein
MKPYIGIYTSANETQATLIAIFCTEHAQFRAAVPNDNPSPNLSEWLEEQLNLQDNVTPHVREYDLLDEVQELIELGDEDITVIEIENPIILQHVMKTLSVDEWNFKMEAEGGVFIFDIPGMSVDELKADLLKDLEVDTDYTIYRK